MLPDTLTIPDLLRHRAEVDGDVAALITGTERISYRALDAESARLASFLAMSGVAKGARVGLMMPNGIGWAVASFAIMRLGAVLVPLSTLLRPPELLQQLRIAAVTHLIAVDTFRQRDYLADLAAIVPGYRPDADRFSRSPALPNLLKIWRWTDLAERDGDAAARELAAGLERRVRPADDMAIIFTSGSRGIPKGVVHTHGNALRATASGLAARCIGPGDRLYIPMPFFWVGGFGGGLLSVLLAGASLLTEDAPEPGETLKFIEREGVTLFRGWPDQAVRMASHPAFPGAKLSSLRPASLNAVLPPALRARPNARANLFGMTETFGPCFGYPLDTDMPEGKFGSTGEAFEGIEVRIAHTVTGDPVPVGETGNILLRGPNLMRGICGRMRESTFTPDGFYNTGDLGRLDEDGFLFYMGRSDDMFKVRGATVYPTEVEAALQSIPGVRRAFATDLTSPVGEPEVAAAVVLDEIATYTVQDLDRRSREVLSAFKVPSVWLRLSRVEDVPVATTGKVDKPALQGKLRLEGVRAAR